MKVIFRETKISSTTPTMYCFTTPNHLSNFITGRNEVVAKVMFLHVCVILFTGGVSGQTPPDLAGRTPPGPGRENPPGPGRENPPKDLAGRTPPGTRQTPPRTRQTPPGEEDCSIRSMSSRYASYWNAFLFYLEFHETW